MKKIISVFCVLAIAWLLVFMVLMFLKIYPAYFVDFSEFDSEKWEKYPNYRYKMLEDFEQKYPIESLDRKIVDELLGDNCCTVTSANPDEGCMYSYVIGEDTSIFAFAQYYAVYFDRYGICIQRNIYVD